MRPDQAAVAAGAATTPRSPVRKGLNEAPAAPERSVDDVTEHLLAGLRERIYARSLPLATRDLPIKVSTLWPNAGVHGLARGIADTVLGAPAG